MAEATINSIVSSSVSEAAPAAEPVWGGDSKPAYFMTVANPGGGNGFRTYMFFALPFSMGAAMVSASLELFVANIVGAATTPATLVIKRILAPWDQDVTWNTKPAVGPALVTTDLVAASSAYVDKRFVVDLMAVMNDVLSDEEDYRGWYGIELSISSVDGLNFYGPQAPGPTSVSRPEVMLQWVGGIYVPSNLMPAGGQVVNAAKPLLSFQPQADGAGLPSDLDAINVQISANANMSNPWDSGWVTTTKAQLDLASTSYGGVADGGTVYWRVRQRNTVGQVSEWSAVTSFKRVSAPTITVTAPATPTSVLPMLVTWGTSLPSGVTATSYQVTITDRDNGVVYYAGRRTSGNPGSVQIPAESIPVVRMKRVANGPVQVEGTPYALEPQLDGNGNFIYTQNLNVTVQVWDDQIRPEAGPTGGINPDNGKPTNPQSYTIGTKNIVLDTTSAASPVTGLAAQNVSPWGSADLTWSRSAVPDEFWISVNGIVVEKITGASARIGSTNNYKFNLNRGLPSRKKVKITVQPKTGTTVLQPVSVDFTGRLVAPALSELDGSNAVLILNPDRDEEVATGDGVLEPIGMNNPILIRQAKSALRRGSLAGVLAGESIPGNTSEADSAKYETLRGGQGRPLLLRMAGVSLRCFITNAQKVEGVDAEGVFYSISLEYYEVR